MNCERHNGFLAWRRLKKEYEPNVPGRHAGMLVGLIAPAWSGVQNHEFKEKLLEWEMQVARYEQQSGETLSGSLKTAVVSRHAPEEVRNAIRTQTSIIGSDYNRLRVLIYDFLSAGFDYNAMGIATAASSSGGGPVPMDVGALSKGKGKGKSKDKSSGKGGYGYSPGHKGKKGEGKKGGKNQQSGRDWLGGKGKGGGGGGKKGNEGFQGNCSQCGQWGHKRAQCTQQRQVGAASADTSSRASSPTPSTSSKSGGVVGAIQSDPFWVAGVMMAGTIGGLSTDHYVMLDTGSEEHVCRPSFAKCSSELQEPMSIMRDIVGREIQNHGTTVLDMNIGTDTVSPRFTVCWQVADVEKNVMSVGKLVDTGNYKVIFDGPESVLIHKPSGQAVKLERKGYTFVLKVRDVAETPYDRPLPEGAPMSMRRRRVSALREGDGESQPSGAAESGGSSSSTSFPSVDSDPPTWPPGLRPDNSIEQMRERLRQLQKPGATRTSCGRGCSRRRSHRRPPQAASPRGQHRHCRFPWNRHRQREKPMR